MNKDEKRTHFFSKLVFSKINTFFRSEQNLIIYLICWISIIISTLIGFILIELNFQQMLIPDLIIIINSILLFFIVLTLSLYFFYADKKNNVITLELRYGVKNKEIYWSRILAIFSIIFVGLAALIIVNLLLISISNSWNSVFNYKLLLISLGWYTLVIIASVSLDLLLLLFFKPIFTIILAIFIFAGNFVVGLGAPERLQGNLQYKESFKNQSGYPNNADFMFKNYLQIEMWREINEISPEFFNWWNFYSEIRNDEIETNGFDFSTDAFLFTDLPKKSYWNQIYVKFPEIAKFYEYFDNFFSKESALKFSDISFEYMNPDSNNLGINITTKIEPISKVTNRMLKYRIDDSYINLIKKLNYLCATNEAERIFTFTIMLPGRDLDDTKEMMEKKEISVDKFIFLKTMENIFLQNKLSIDFKNNSNKEEITKMSKSLKSYSEHLNRVRKMMIWNPLSHFSLMFHSSNYNNPISYAYIMETNLFIRSFENYHYIINDEEIDNGQTLIGAIEGRQNFTRSVYPELYYLVYVLIDFLLIMILWPLYGKKIRK